MASKVLIKLPVVLFPQEKKSSGDMLEMTERNIGTNYVSQTGLNIDRATQLEQNMKFLQEQHQRTLLALHQEVESLRQRNRDLQFQLVFSKGAICTSSPSSPEDNENGFVKPKGSPGCVNVTPLQVELLEKELQDIKASLQDAKAHNQYLTEIMEQQRKRLNLTEERRNKIVTADVGIQVEDKLVPVHTDIVTQWEGPKTMVKQLHRENVDKKWEIPSCKSTDTNNGGINRGNRSRDTNNSYHTRALATAQEQTSQKFPPLQTQSYWHRRLPSLDHGSDYPRSGRNRHEKQDIDVQTDNTVLPQLQTDGLKGDPMAHEPTSYRSRGYHNYYREGGNRKYRGQMSQRERKDPENRCRREHKDRSFKDHQKGCVDAAEGLRNTENTRNQ